MKICVDDFYYLQEWMELNYIDLCIKNEVAISAIEN